ncbi:DEAD/DEAH box helicase [Halieaceae bacterium IMCC14734]|uniref:DEAD/DEAH box helicase n=1 Tax=Candidatus Litorirhabdus singularis TaxID=2518993 RepID=A0ABT3THZ0_9GAMM|nr:DEAD/DEAH box helicase [Candidatus Litorirhabdus singularis]MCX2981937.1 DEAD/DEAH box helicase [Candidatus Litorirhabdus singularis]
MTTFNDLGLAENLLRAVTAQGYTTPSPIQAKAIPLILAGRDVMAAAQTGTGKTAGFTLPLLQRLDNGKPANPNRCRALVLTPTRELAAQVEQSVVTYGQFTNTSSTVVFGGVKMNPQLTKLRGGVDVLVATPGRLLDLHGQKAIRFDDVEVLILDEADRMLDMGFIHDIRKIINLVPKQRQTLMFSATFSKEIRQMAGQFLKDPKQVEVNPANATAELVKQWVHPVDKKRKAELLCHLINSKAWNQVLIFSRTKHGADKLSKQLEKNGISAAPIHGDKSQNARTRALESFKKGRIQALVATDVAARGLDIEQLPQVVNFDLPNIAEDYVHRIGRTGRAGSAGHAYSLVSADEADYLAGIEKLIRRKIDRIDIEGFEPDHDVPEGRAGRVAASNSRRESGRSAHNRGNNGGKTNNSNTTNSGRRRGRSGGNRQGNGRGNK